MTSSQFGGRAVAALLVLCGVGAVGCRSTYYKTMEGFGREKREILSSRVEDTVDVLVAARDDVRAASEQLVLIQNLDERGKLEERYDRLRRGSEGARRHSAQLREQVADTERVANDLFKEWREEIDRLSDATLREPSQRNLDATRERYLETLAQLRRAERSLAAVVEPLEERTLVVKHAVTAPPGTAVLPEPTDFAGDLRQALADLEGAIDRTRSLRSSLEG